MNVVQPKSMFFSSLQGKATIDFSNFIFSVAGEKYIEGTLPVSNFESWEKKRDHRWVKNKLQRCNHARSCASIVFFGNFLYLIGGYNGIRSTDSIERYDFLTNSWLDMKKLKHRRSSCDSVLVLDNNNTPRIYVIGGVQDNTCVKEIEVYDVNTNQIKTESLLSNGRSGCRTFYYNEQIYIFGGVNEDNGEQANHLPILKYSLRDKTLTTLSSTYSKTSFGACLYVSPLDKKLYLLLAGGSETSLTSPPTKDVFIFDFERETINSVDTMNYPRAFFNLVYYQGDIYAFGGYDGKNIVETLEIFDIHRNRWYKYYGAIGMDLRYSYCGSHVVSMPHYRLIVEGQWQDNNVLDGYIMTRLKEKGESSGFNYNSWKEYSIFGEFKQGKRHGIFHSYLDNCNQFLYFENDIPLSLKVKQYEDELKTLTDIPDELKCPISLQLFRNPVIISSGMCYEEEDILNWLKTNSTDPMTRSPVKKKTVFPCLVVKNLVMKYLEKKKIEIPEF